MDTRFDGVIQEDMAVCFNRIFNDYAIMKKMQDAAPTDWRAWCFTKLDVKHES